MAELAFTILDPAAVRVRRVLHPDFGDRIVTTIEFEFEGAMAEAEVAYPIKRYGEFLLASLEALGLPEGDMEYLSDRLEKDLT